MMSPDSTTTHLSDRDFYAGLLRLPRPRYPFPDAIHPDYQQQRLEYYDWIDREYTFHSKAAREKHKRHNLTDIAARGCPSLHGIAELRPLADYAANGAMMDDYWDGCTRDEMYDIGRRIMALLSGEDADEPPSSENGIFHQFWVLRQDALKCGMPERLYKNYIASIHRVFVGYAEERVYYRNNKIPSLAVYWVIREDTSGAHPFGELHKMVDEYVQDLGVCVAGVYAWHTQDTSRYVNGGYVEGEYIRTELGGPKEDDEGRKSRTNGVDDRGPRSE